MNIVDDFLTFNYTPNGMKEIRGLLCHSMWGTYAGSVAWFKNPEAKASSHYCISKEGEIRHMVDEGKNDMAWHGGYVDVPPAPDWILPNPNNYLIGIELEDCRDVNWQYPEAQRKATAELVGFLCVKYGLARDRCLLHKETNPSRRSDPVGQFSWDWVFPNEPAPNGDEERALEVLRNFKIVTDEFSAGNLEGATRGLIAYYTDHTHCPANLASLRTDLLDAFNKEKIALKQSHVTEISEINEKWQSELTTANERIEELEENGASALSYSQLFSLAWKKWWNWKRNS